MFKNFLKSTIVAALILNPLLASAEPRVASEGVVSQDLNTIANERRASLRTAEGKQQLFEFFSGLSKQEQQEYLATSEYSQREMKRMIEALKMKIETAKDEHGWRQIELGAALAAFISASGVGLAGDHIVREHKNALRNVKKESGVRILNGGDVVRDSWSRIIEANRAKNPALMAQVEHSVLRIKFGTSLMSSSMIVLAMTFFHGAMSTSVMKLTKDEITNVSNVVDQIIQDLNSEIEMVAALRAYSQTN